MRRAVGDPRPRPDARSGAGLRALLASGIAGLESVPVVRAAPASPPVTAAPAPIPSIDRFLYRGPAALAAARGLTERWARASRAPTPAELDELHALLRLADEG